MSPVARPGGGGTGSLTPACQTAAACAAVIQLAPGQAPLPAIGGARMADRRPGAAAPPKIDPCAGGARCRAIVVQAAPDCAWRSRRSSYAAT